MKKVISVTVPAYNEEKLIAECLDSLLNQTLNQDQYEIIVIDNNSTDSTAKIAADKGIRVEKELKKGYVHAIRKGIEVSQAEIIAFTDADCRVPANWVATILNDFSSSLDIIAVGGKLSFYDVNRLFDWFIRLILFYINALPGNNMAIKRDGLSQIGGVDPNINLAVDFWLTKKLKKVGRLKIDKKMVVGTSARRFKRSFISDVQYFINVVSISIISKPLYYDFPDVREGSGKVLHVE